MAFEIFAVKLKNQKTTLNNEKVVKGSATKSLEEAQNATDSLEAMIPHLNAVGTSATELLDLSESLRDNLVDNPSWTYDAMVSLVDLAEARRLVRKQYDELRAAENVNDQNHTVLSVPIATKLAYRCSLATIYICRHCVPFSTLNSRLEY
jgi:hypothetical protein